MSDVKITVFGTFDNKIFWRRGIPNSYGLAVDITDPNYIALDKLSVGYKLDSNSLGTFLKSLGVNITISGSLRLHGDGTGSLKEDVAVQFQNPFDEDGVAIVVQRTH